MKKQIIIAALCPIICTVVLAAADDLTVYVAPAEYYSTVYVSPAQGSVDYVFLRGEPLAFRISVLNHGPDVTLAGREPGLMVRARRAGTEQGVSGVAISSIRRNAVISRKSQALLFPLRIRTSDSIQWTATVSGLEMAPAGIYDLQFELSTSLYADSTSGATPLALSVNNDRVRIDLRDVNTFEAKVEQLRIWATRAYVNRSYPTCVRFADALLALYPTAAYGEILKADAAAAQGNKQSAAAGYERGLSFIEQRRDTLLLSKNGPHVLEELANAVHSKLASVR